MLVSLHPAQRIPLLNVFLLEKFLMDRSLAWWLQEGMTL